MPQDFSRGSLRNEGGEGDDREERGVVSEGVGI